MFIAGIAGAGSMGAFVGIMLSIFVIIIVATIFIYIRPAWFFKSCGIPGWKAFVPVYNLWVGFSEIANAKWLFFVWLIPASVAGVCVVLMRQVPSLEIWGQIGTLCSLIPVGILAMCDSEHFSIIGCIYNAIVLDAYGICGIVYPFFFLLRLLSIM